MKHYTLKLKTTSTVDYNLYDGTTLVSDSALTTLFATAGEAYFTFDFNSLTPTDTTSLNILNSSSTAVIANTGLTGIAEDKNFKGTWSASATAFDTFVALTGVAMDESQLSTLVGMIKSAGPTIVQTTGTSTTDVMSQNAAGKMIWPNPSTKAQIIIGTNNSSNKNQAVGIGYSFYNGASNAITIGHNSAANSPNGVCVGAASSSGLGVRATSGIALGYNASVGDNSDSAISIGSSSTVGQSHPGAVAVGGSSSASSTGGVSIGDHSSASATYSVALGAYSKATTQGQFDISTGVQTTSGYNSSNYRLISGVYDGQSAHDAATYGQLNTRLGGLSIVSISQTDYDNLQNKDPNTLYVISEDESGS